jgi:hypothetical protein
MHDPIYFPLYRYLNFLFNNEHSFDNLHHD